MQTLKTRYARVSKIEINSKETSCGSKDHIIETKTADSESK